MSRAAHDRSERVVYTNFAALFKGVKESDIASMMPKADPKFSLMNGLIQIEEVGTTKMQLLQSPTTLGRAGLTALWFHHGFDDS